MKASSPIPSEILDRCRLLKQQWALAQRLNAPQTSAKKNKASSRALPHFASDASI